MKLSLKNGLLLTSIFALSLVAAPVLTQDLAPPTDVPQEVIDMFGGNMGAGTVTYAPPEQAESAAAMTENASLAGERYIYTSLRVITTGSSRGCSISNWNCMANLCKSDLGQSAFHGWAGCWRDGSNYICNFERGQVKDMF